MEFRLTYFGPLNSDAGARQKQSIRRQLHPQLSELWGTHPVLLHVKQLGLAVSDFESPPRLQNVTIDRFADNFKTCGFRFAPLVSEYLRLVCSLDILFLRREDAGSVIKQGGDIDNRLKTLFDALRMPKNCAEADNQTPTSGEDPFFCLLQDDSLITEFKVTTDRLLIPKVGDQSDNNVSLVIAVKIKPTRPSNERNLSFV